MNLNRQNVKYCIDKLALILEDNNELKPQHYATFLANPDLALRVIDLISSLNNLNENYYMACTFVLDVCISQLQCAKENGNNYATRILGELMQKIANTISNGQHELSFWLNILNIFYNTQLQLTPALSKAYYNLAKVEIGLPSAEKNEYLNNMRTMIVESTDLSDFELADNLFAQSYAFPPVFFGELVKDLFKIPEGHDLALLTLLHPAQEVRAVIVATFEQIINTITLSSLSLTRLRMIKNWYPTSYAAIFARWLNIQKKKGVIFCHAVPAIKYKITASEIDGTGAQGLYIHLQANGKNKICSLLFKQGIGIKNIWTTPFISKAEGQKLLKKTATNLVMLEVNFSYLLQITEHFLALMLAQEKMPDLYLLEIQELLGCQFYPHLIDVKSLMITLNSQYNFDLNSIYQESIQRSKLWKDKHNFVKSWYDERTAVDKIVNKFCCIVNGTRVCSTEKAIAAIFKDLLEKQREQWVFHFLWISVWAQSKNRKYEELAFDSLCISYAIYSGFALQSIPIMQTICYQSVVNSIETMTERRAHLNLN